MGNEQMAEVDEEKCQIPQTHAVSHPRRIPAHKSVSLVHSHKSSPSTATRLLRHDQRAVNATSQTASSATPPNTKRDPSSGESSNADGWFEASNNNVYTRNSSLTDNDPPFFLRNSSSSETPLDVRHTQISIPHRGGFMRTQSGESGSDGFRSVIDDLTVENKKLKKRLKKYERLHDVQLQSDKLFEIRMHGLPPAKKRELEATLRTFASSLDATPHTTASGRRADRFPRPSGQLQMASSSTSTRLADSAYASLSGQTISAPVSGQCSTSRKKSSQPLTQQQRRSIRSYLHKIPTSNAPTSVATMTERTRQQLVVRRLEQLFTGKGPTAEGHQQPLQQEEVAQSAARVDRSAIKASGQQAAEEGSREARIGSTGSEDRAQSAAPALNAAVGKSPEQRPTRPLDLDPHRAQIPAENIEYMRHLGFSPPDIGANAGLADDHGYVYLNVLTNMAQLHDINVTPNVVKNAITEYSTKLELSHDGRKVRWKGGSSLTRTSSDRSSPQSANTSPEHLSKVGTRDRTECGAANNTGSNARASEAAHPPSTHGKFQQFAYVPLVTHRQQNSVGDSDSEEDLSGWPSPATEGTVVRLGGRTVSRRKRQGESGALIFYNNASFCTDLSRETRNSNSANDTAYFRAPTHPIGLPRQPTIALETSSGIGEPKGPLSLPTQKPFDAMDVDQTSSIGDDLVVGISKPPSMVASSSEESAEPIDLEASGIGGVHLTDNFAISIKSRQKLSSNTSPAAPPANRNKTYPAHIRNVLNESKGPSSQPRRPACAFNTEIVSSKCKQLPPSALPPPSFYPLSSSPDEDDDFNSDADSEMSDSPATNEKHLPSAALQPSNWPALNSSLDLSSEASDVSDEGEEESESSIDMLAHARHVDPASIRAQEREYDGTIAERLAEEIPAGSSAATPGGGSGFNSPLSRALKSPQLRLKGANMASPPPLKRVRI